MAYSRDRAEVRFEAGFDSLSVIFLTGNDNLETAHQNANFN